MKRDNIRYSFNPTYDTLMIYLGTAKHVSSEEIMPGVYLVIDEDTQEVIAIEVMDFKSRNTANVIPNLPEQLRESVTKVFLQAS